MMMMMLQDSGGKVEGEVARERDIYEHMQTSCERRYGRLRGDVSHVKWHPCAGMVRDCIQQLSAVKSVYYSGKSHRYGMSTAPSFTALWRTKEVDEGDEQRCR